MKIPEQPAQNVAPATSEPGSWWMGLLLILIFVAIVVAFAVTSSTSLLDGI